MLTPKGEHSIPLFYQGDVRWENHFRRHRNRRQKLGDRILNFPAHSSQVKNPAKNKASKHWQPRNLSAHNISTAGVEKDFAGRFRPGILGLN
jgi:hypothetical protein